MSVPRRRPARVWLCIEHLEDRCCPSHHAGGGPNALPRPDNPGPVRQAGPRGGPDAPHGAPVASVVRLTPERIERGLPGGPLPLAPAGAVSGPPPGGGPADLDGRVLARLFGSGFAPGVPVGAEQALWAWPGGAGVTTPAAFVPAAQPSHGVSPGGVTVPPATPALPAPVPAAFAPAPPVRHAAPASFTPYLSDLLHAAAPFRDPLARAAQALGRVGPAPGTAARWLVRLGLAVLSAGAGVWYALHLAHRRWRAARRAAPDRIDWPAGEPRPWEAS